MRIAIASADGVHIFDHFGRSPAFTIVEVESGRIARRTMRTNDFTPHARRRPGEERDHDHGTHSHQAIREALKDCQVVISRGMGRRAHEDLRAAGIEMIVTDEIEVDAAVHAYVAGTLRDRIDRLHDHHRH